MRLGLIYSAIFHLAIIVMTVFVWPNAWRDLEAMPTVLPVELITVDEMTNIQAKPEPEPEAEEDEAAEVEPEPEAPPPPPKEVAALSPEPEPEPEPIPELAPEPKPEPVPEPEVKKEEPKPKTTAKARPRVRPKPPPEKKKFDYNKVAALLDKMPVEETKQHVPTALEKIAAQSQQRTQQVGLGTSMTLSEIDALRLQVEKCWSFPAGAANPEDLIVTVQISLNPDGSLGKTPEILEKTKLAIGGDQFFRVAAESALRAVRRCAPYKMPIDKYQSWRQIELRFDPREMLGG
jgi:outer membrane biosynthesis protein TonB